MSENNNNFIPTFTYVEDLAKQNQIKREKKDSIIQNKINKKEIEKEKEREINEKEKEINAKRKEIEKDNEFIPIGLTKLNDCIYINPILQLLGGISDFLLKINKFLREKVKFSNYLLLLADYIKIFMKKKKQKNQNYIKVIIS